MPTNIEIKAPLSNITETQTLAHAIADQGPTQINQHDTFFHCPKGRLKLRTFNPTKGELIYYQRPNQPGPKQSNYIITPTTNPSQLTQTLKQAYGILGEVKKQRTLYLIGRTRIHLDQVEQLGNFIELEVVLTNNEPTETAQQEANQLMQKLNIEPQHLIDNAYIDLLHEIQNQ